VTTRITRVSRTSKPAVVQVVCPGCRGIRRAQPVGTAVIGKQRKEVLQCLDADCGLTWVPTRSAIPEAPAKAA
jgi:hypothetical protein